MTAPDPIALALHEAREYVSLDRDMPGGPRLLMLIDEALRALAASGEDESKYDNAMFNVGVQHVVDLLAKTIEAEGWVAGDGFEDYDDDLAQTLLNILAARGLYDKEEGEFAAPAAPVEAKPVAWRYKCHDGSIVVLLEQLTDEQKRRGYYTGEDGEDEVDEDDALVGPFHWGEETPLYATLPASPSPDLRGALEAAREFVALCAKPAFGARTCLAKIDAALAATGGKE